MRLQTSLKVGILSIFLCITQFSEAIAMGATPDNNMILISCKVKGAIAEAPKFAAAICPVFIQAVSVKWPEKTVIELEGADHDAGGIVIELTTDIHSKTAAVSMLRWDKAYQWGKDAAQDGEQITLQVMDGTLTASMAEQLARDILKVNATVISD
ncbi:MAG: hypothetical protein V3V13_08575 [Paracoccaceae bacterium]